MDLIVTSSPWTVLIAILAAATSLVLVARGWFDGWRSLGAKPATRAMQLGTSSPCSSSTTRVPAAGWKCAA